MPTARATVLVALAAALAAACTACGSATTRRAPTGAAVFAANCAACHSLVGNESAHKQGGDLLGYAMTRAQLTGFTRVMPTRSLSAAEVRAVVDYVLAAQARAQR